MFTRLVPPVSTCRRRRGQHGGQPVCKARPAVPAAHCRQKKRRRGSHLLQENASIVRVRTLSDMWHALLLL